MAFSDDPKSPSVSSARESKTVRGAAGTSSRAVTTRVLIADDEPDLELLVRQRFRKQIRDGKYDFVFVPNGTHALNALRGDPGFEVMLTDINMPEMDGLTLLSRVIELDASLLPVVVSAYGDMSNIRAAMNLGAFDFLTKPIDFLDLETTLDRTVRQALQVKQAERARRELSSLQCELGVATRIQRSLLPMAFRDLAGPSNLEVEAAMHPAREVGGDFYDFFPIDAGRYGFAIGDVSGKGVPAAIFMAVCRTLLKSIALRGLDPGDCLTEVNRSLCLDNKSEMFVTLFYAVLDARTGELRYASGGHNPPYLVGGDGRVVPLDGSDGTVLGLLEGGPIATAAVTLRPAEVVVAYTDGVTEATAADGRLFGAGRLEDHLRGVGARPAGEVVRGLLDAVRAFTADAPQFDDITAMAVRFGAA